MNDTMDAAGFVSTNMAFRSWLWSPVQGQCYFFPITILPRTTILKILLKFPYPADSKKAGFLARYSRSFSPCAKRTVSHSIHPQQSVDLKKITSLEIKAQISGIQIPFKNVFTRSVPCNFLVDLQYVMDYLLMSSNVALFFVRWHLLSHNTR